MSAATVERKTSRRMTRAGSLSSAAVRKAQLCKPLGSYTRVSKDKSAQAGGKGAGMAVKRQHAENVDYFVRAGYVEEDETSTRIEHYSDNDRSGWDPDVIRPDFERLLEDIRAGKLRAVIAWHSDRFTRQPLQLELLWAACKQSGTELHTVLGGHITDVTMLRIQGALSAQESDIKSERQLLKHGQLADMGEFHGGRRRFGYLPGLKGKHPIESKALEEVTERFLAGETLYSLAKYLNEYEWTETVTDADGIAQEVTRVGLFTPSTGSHWTGPNLRQTLKGPHLAGLRVHHKEIVSTATWPQIISCETHEAIVARLSNADRKTSTSNARVYLLAGLACCATCHTAIRGRPASKKVKQYAYACSTGRHVHCNGPAVDAVVTIEVKAVLAKMRADGVFVDEEETKRVDALHVRRGEIEEAMSATAKSLAEGRIKQRGHDRTMLSLETELEDIEEDINAARERAHRPERALEGMLGPDPALAFDDAPLSRQRAVIDLLFTVELVGRSQSGRSRFDPELDVLIVPKLKTKKKTKKK
jgi:DNA invertase Pin-like site-specific DNA recombinase